MCSGQRAGIPVVCEIANRLREQTRNAWIGRSCIVLTPLDDDVRETISKCLCRIARHQAVRRGLQIDEEAWVDFLEVTHVTDCEVGFTDAVCPEDVIWVAENCPKGRFMLSYDVGPSSRQKVLVNPPRDYSKPTRTRTRNSNGKVVWVTTYPTCDRDPRMPCYLKCVQGHSDDVCPGGLRVTTSETCQQLVGRWGDPPPQNGLPLRSDWKCAQGPSDDVRPGGASELSRRRLVSSWAFWRSLHCSTTALRLRMCSQSCAKV